jgi:hypothetical protein
MCSRLFWVPSGTDRETSEGTIERDGDGVRDDKGQQKPHDSPARLVLKDAEVAHANREFRQTREEWINEAGDESQFKGRNMISRRLESNMFPCTVMYQKTVDDSQYKPPNLQGVSTAK